ncbi:phage protein Gp27 family protein [Variovorax sp. VNK109]|uniref:phage protein Gp27 family protein n=1 Tax=Variovorax sp. VNK109 TaxID=3400919 RepID=UPI003C08C6D6
MPSKSTFKRKPSRPSSITQLDPRVKEAVDEAVRDGRLTIDQIVRLIEEQGAEASRSAVGRYVKNARERMEDYRQAQQIATVWVNKLGKEPEGDIGRMLLEMLRVVAFKSIGDMEAASPEDLMFLGKALKDIAGADKLVVDREVVVRKLIAAEAVKVAAEVATTAKKAGLSDDTIDLIKKRILGVADAKPKGAA